MIFRPVLEDNQWKIRTKIELEKLQENLDTGTPIELQHLRWTGQLQRTDDARNTKKMNHANLCQQQYKGKPQG